MTALLRMFAAALGAVFVRGAARRKPRGPAPGEYRPVPVAPPPEPAAAPPPAGPRRRRLSARRMLALGAGLVGLAALAVVVAVGGEQPKAGGPAVASLEAGESVRDTEEAQAHPEPESAGAHPLAASPEEAATAEEGISPGAPSDEEVRRDLRELERYYGRRPGSKGGGVSVSAGMAQTPPGAPRVVEQAVAAGNAIARFPYRWGGGHGSFIDDAYDCSGSVSYALAAAGLLDAPLASGDLMGWGEPGPGRWVTVYANPGHVYMEVGGLRFDTSGRDGRRGSRWQAARRSAAGFEARHWPGL
jgi:cell wall-associated NlpC family hydrolase